MLTFSISLSSCQKEDNETETYLKEYRHYKQVVSHLMGTMEKELSDTLRNGVETFIGVLSVRSCFFCIELGPSPNVIQHKESLLFIADAFFRGKDGRLKYIFQSWFKRFYREQYELLLEDFDIQEAVEWRDMEEEYNNLPMENMFDKYLEVEFGLE